MDTADILTEIFVIISDIEGEKRDVIANMLFVNMKMQCVFKNSKYLREALLYINEYYTKFLNEVDFEHQTYEKIIAYFESCPNLTKREEKRILNNIKKMMKFFSEQVDERLICYYEFDLHCKDLIKYNFLTAKNYMFLPYQSPILESKDYIRNLMPTYGELT